jgi:hypothetical protein
VVDYIATSLTSEDESIEIEKVDKVKEQFKRIGSDKKIKEVSLEIEVIKQNVKKRRPLKEVDEEDENRSLASYERAVETISDNGFHNKKSPGQSSPGQLSLQLTQNYDIRDPSGHISIGD